MQGKTPNPPPPPPPPSHVISMPDASNSNVVEKRVYQIWKGNNRFCCGGRVVLGPDVRSIMLTLFLIVTPVISFCIFGARAMVESFSPRLGTLTVAFPAGYTVYIVILLFITSARDPGIVPRSVLPPEMEDEGDTPRYAVDWPVHRIGSSVFRPTKDVLIDGMVVKVKYCHTCMLYRPPRSSHCSVCNNCVERFDHHCPWVGQCIGKRNYVFFFMFVSSTAILCLYVFAFSWVNVSVIMRTCHCNLWRAFLKSPVSCILIIYTFVCAWFVGGLTAFHLYLISINQTTYENFRYRYDGKMNSYNRGLLHNFREVFCSKIPKSRIDFRAKVKETPAKQIASGPSTSIEMGRAPSSSMGMARIMSPKVHQKSFDGEKLHQKSFDGEKMHQKSFDVEMARKQKAVAQEDLHDVQSQMSSRLDRCDTGTSSTSWDHRSRYEITPDIHSMVAELGKGHYISERGKE